jgi:hypothetical protein
MRKPQSQPSLASLTEADREQLADWLRQEEYATVLSRVNSPRPDGFGLSLSTEKPLRTFYAKVALMDLVNFRLPQEKRFTLAQFECLAQRDIHLLTSADHEQLAGAHEQILRTVTDLASAGDNTPTQLLALQRLADFPARAALREQMAELHADRLQLQLERQDRLKAMQAHRIAMDLRREERVERREKRCAEMNAHKLQRDSEQSERAAKRMEFTAAHLNIATKRLRLTAKSLAFRRRQHRDRSAADSQRSTLNSQLPPQADHLGPYAVDLEGIRERARKHFGITPEESARRAALRKAWRDQESSNSGDKTHAPAAPVLMPENLSPEGILDNSPGASAPVFVREIPSPEGTLENSPAPSVPGHSTTFPFSPEGTAELHPLHELQTAMNESDELTESNQ